MHYQPNNLLHHDRLIVDTIKSSGSANESTSAYQPAAATSDRLARRRRAAATKLAAASVFNLETAHDPIIGLRRPHTTSHRISAAAAAAAAQEMQPVCANFKPNFSQRTRMVARSLLATSCLMALVLVGAQAASVNRVNMHQVSKQTNQYFLNEFCDLESKTLRSARKLKQASDTHSLFLTSKNTLSSVRVLPQKQQLPSSISFGFGSTGQQQPQQQAPLVKQLNCSIIVVAPKSHGLLVTVNSIGLPKNLTKLGIILNHDSSHAQHVHLEGETTSAQYLLTQPQSSKIAINLQSFQPIDWSHVSFDILFTVYKKGNSTGCPNKKWFDCGDNICVPSSLVCDRNRNCPNGNDEMIFYRCYSPLLWSIAASSALALILIVLIISVIVVVRNRRAGRLSKLNSFSNNQLAADADLMHDGSKLDLTQADMQQAAHHGLAAGRGKNGSYLASNLYLGGFENPVWTSNGTLTKQQKTTSGGIVGPSAPM